MGQGDMLIRKLEKTDVEDVTRLSDQLGYPTSMECMIQNIEMIKVSDDHEAFVAVDASNDQLLGWIHVFLTHRLESGSFCEIGGMVVDENVRGKGIGTKLVKAAQDWSIGKRCFNMRVRTNVVREKTQKFYHQQGFKPGKRQQVFIKTLQ
ncbi:GNAT family N-acetyltransferase [Fulvivirgaceae bacterium BMA10]|uniref:GNAT family N-acetyltransferase n=1 Tax=Splendidivirga corallicola TaxID=3051826 RepID=A0ABT8KR85_9BACT|nr:GNAT family N-acetyltransferase [Fulvivirgaceae bacterium BMA10]